MTIKDLSDDHLNLFIDEELDTDELNEIRQAVMEDKELRERVCQLKAVRELVGYAYSDVPGPDYESQQVNKSYSMFGKAIAASVTLVIGVFLGWETYHFSPQSSDEVSAENTFQYVANHVAVDHSNRKIILHIDSGDLQVVNAALNEADHLLATYKKANVPMKLDVITNKGGINMLRPGVSPYVARIQKMIQDEDVSFFACERSVAKAHKREGVEIKLIPGVEADKSARDLIPDRLEKGWVYIKA
jgi:intracellular sulfur oxidation DsrE/DsrF family protein